MTRLRLGLEGTWRGLEIGTGTLVPRLEIGVRHDGGDAETGFGLDLGGGLAWSDPGTGIRAEASARGLLTHRRVPRARHCGVVRLGPDARLGPGSEPDAEPDHGRLGSRRGGRAAGPYHTGGAGGERQRRRAGAPAPGVEAGLRLRGVRRPVGTGTLVPRLEIGVRHDGGDAETGFGLDLGGGLAFSVRTPVRGPIHSAWTGIRAEANARGLLTHESAGFRERGIAGSFGWDPTPGSDRGPSLTLRGSIGPGGAGDPATEAASGRLSRPRASLPARGGADALLGRTALAGLAANDNGDELERRRLELKLGYGFGAFGNRNKGRLPAHLPRPVHLDAGGRVRDVGATGTTAWSGGSCATGGVATSGLWSSPWRRGGARAPLSLGRGPRSRRCRARARCRVPDDGAVLSVSVVGTVEGNQGDSGGLSIKPNTPWTGASRWTPTLAAKLSEKARPPQPTGAPMAT